MFLSAYGRYIGCQAPLSFRAYWRDKNNIYLLTIYSMHDNLLATILMC